MQHKNLLFFSALLFGWTLVAATLRDPSNPPVGATGAPGEGTCEACHTGGNQTGTVTITGVPDTVVAGRTYPITLTNRSNAARAGFQLTCLDASLAMCGTLIAGTGVNIGSGDTRKYARQSSAKNLSAGSTSWTFNWQAPNAVSGDKATFYYSSLCADGNGRITGDRVLVNKTTVTWRSNATTPTQELAAQSLCSVYPTLVSDELNVEWKTNEVGQLALFDLNGRRVLTQRLTASTSLNLAFLPKGTYLVHITAAGQAYRQKIILK